MAIWCHKKVYLDFELEPRLVPPLAKMSFWISSYLFLLNDFAFCFISSSLHLQPIFASKEKKKRKKVAFERTSPPVWNVGNFFFFFEIGDFSHTIALSRNHDVISSLKQNSAGKKVNKHLSTSWQRLTEAIKLCQSLKNKNKKKADNRVATLVADLIPGFVKDDKSFDERFADTT